MQSRLHPCAAAPSTRARPAGRWRPHAALAVALATAAVALPSGPGYASGQPVQVLQAPAVPAPVDQAFAGNIELDVQATDVARRLFTVRVRMPVQQAGALTLLYPRWDTGSHGPSLTVTDLAGLVVSADGQPLAWQRHPLEPHAFRVDVPAGARTIEARYQIIGDANVLARDVVVVPWHRLVLYPAGWYARNLVVTPQLTLPAGLAPVSSLQVAATGDASVRFAPVTLETLLDSPVYGARHARRIALDFPGDAPVALNLIAGSDDVLDVPAEPLAALQRMGAQAASVFGAPPFDRYEFLARLENDAATGGIEHRRSGEISLPSHYFSAWDSQIIGRDIIAHELVHAWNGLYRVPADQWAPTPNTPQGTSLLWMYEGQTEFWGRVLAARAGLRSHQETLDQLALDAAEVANRPGRAWRNLADDVRYPAFMLRQAVPWRDWQRRKDYYVEGVMLWLAVDATLRERSAGRKGLDDFARHFFAGASDGAPARTYTFEAICEALEATVPHDWAGELSAWVQGHQEVDTTAGLRRHGWQLVYSDTPTQAFLQQQEESGVTDLSYSLGLAVSDNGLVRAVAWQGPAFEAGLAPRDRVVAVQGAPFDSAALVEAVRNAAQSPVRLTIEHDGERVEQTIAYRGTLRYPRLARVEGTTDTLTSLLQPR
ncbi:M61 family peptidase [Luteimonas sp. M1R5S18]|uniref:M61 family peptidase n=1 Tax=Luteimonas rhizosphaericola TaxID=3042024 RepID=A0ABT6JLH7_9GAMM|nr:PDZ domain-containing protein [Luteimonas rhizosphaericola]MDH5831529.1 M61 family peptidase [Luteimonas rhizosphaericola]